MPWEPGDGFGFKGPGVEPWLPFGTDLAREGTAVGDSVLLAPTTRRRPVTASPAEAVVIAG